MTRFYAANNWKTTIAEVGGIDNSVTSFDVASVAGAPDTPFKITVGNEIMDVTDITGVTLTVDRGREGTVAASHANGTPVEHRFTAGTLNELWGSHEDHLADDTPHEGYIMPKNLPITAERTGETYTLALTDNGSLIPMHRATAQTLIVPLDDTADFPIGAQILIWQKGEGQVTITGESDGEEVTLLLFEDEDTTIGQNAVAGLIKVAADTWLLFGRLEAAA